MATSTLTGDSKDVHRLQLHEEQIRDSKKDLSAIKMELISLDLEEGDELVMKQAELERLLFDCSLKVKELLARSSTPASSSSAHVESPAQAGYTNIQWQHTPVEKFLGTICYISSQSQHAV